MRLILQTRVGTEASEHILQRKGVRILTIGLLLCMEAFPVETWRLETMRQDQTESTWEKGIADNASPASPLICRMYVAFLYASPMMAANRDALAYNGTQIARLGAAIP